MAASASGGGLQSPRRRLRAAAAATTAGTAGTAAAVARLEAEGEQSTTAREPCAEILDVMGGAMPGVHRHKGADVAAFSAGIVGRLTQRIVDDSALLLTARLWADRAARADGQDRHLLRLAAAPELADIRASFEASPGLWSDRPVPRTRVGQRYRAKRCWHRLVAAAAAAASWTH
ncbi:MAG: hypothetical protein INR62_00740 [Rhodospirillales bacterium]|nr:hypothetical protein [Acetobacter sp.]